MRIFKNAWFNHFADKQRISDAALLEAIARIEKGQIDADLGGGVIKQRIARQGQGKSGGFRTVILYRAGNRAFFVYGFAKNNRDNISEIEKIQFRKSAAHVLELTDAALDKLIDNHRFSEI